MAWKDLTDRQKQLDRLIDGCGVRLDATNRCVEKVARSIGICVDKYFGSIVWMIV